jgi:GTP-binding protein HflX
VQQNRAVQRQSRAGSFKASLVGYTNAGKSSILRGMTGSMDVHVEDRLFATLDPLTREVDLGENAHVLLTDTVGFIRKLPHHLVASFRATLEEARAADVLLHVVDASHPDWEGQMRVVERVLAELDLADRPMLIVFNKMDAVSDPQSFAARVRELYPDALTTSTMRTDGMLGLRARLRELERRGRPTVKVRLPVADGARVAAIYREGEVLGRQDGDQEVELTVRLDRWQVERLKEDGVTVDELGSGSGLKRASGA